MSSFVSTNAVKPPPSKPKMTNAKSSSYYSSLPLPNELIIKCLAFVPICDYPSISCVCKTFRDFIASPELYKARSLLGCTENVLYIALGYHYKQSPIWYTLKRKPYGNEPNSYNHKLVPISSLRSLPCWGSSVIPIGHKIYVFGGCINDELTSNVFVINCRYGTSRSLPSMRVARGCAAFGVVDKKIYIMGGCTKEDALDDWVEVFDLVKEIWVSFSGLYNEELSERTLKSLVMNEKIYVMDRREFVYDPKENTWEREDTLSIRRAVGSCVIDNIMYTCGLFHTYTFGYGTSISIRCYDPKTKIWKYVKGVEKLPNMTSYLGARIANRNGNLVIAFKSDPTVGGKKLWCTEISLERRDDGEIWGKVLWSNLVMSLEQSHVNIVQCFNVLI